MPEPDVAPLKTTLSLPPLNRDYEEPWNQLIIDLDALEANYRTLRESIPYQSALYAVLKSDAYGHGLREVGRRLSRSGCRHFAVETPQDGILLRKLGIDSEILLLNPIPDWMAEMAVYYDFSVTVIHESILQPLEDAAAAMDKRHRIHLNVNVGLQRMGIPPSKLLRVARDAQTKPHLQLEGIYAQPRDDKNAMEGFLRLKQLCRKLEDENILPHHCHYSNSISLLTHPETAEFGVRLGILLYGVMPPERAQEKTRPFAVKPVMTLTSHIVQLRSLDKGSRIGYRAKSAIARDSIIGTLPIGYAHGLDRKLAQEGHVLIRGHQAPFIGSVSMNSSTVDLTDIPHVRLYEPVTIIGESGSRNITMNDMAKQVGCIAAEQMLRFGKGISRSYKAKTTRKKSGELQTRTTSLDDIHFMLLRSENDLPDWLDASTIIQFLEEHMAPYNDPHELLREAIDYSLSMDPEGTGFIITAAIRDKLVGSLVCVRMNTTGFIPENILVYLCVHRQYRRQGIGRFLLQQAIENTDGNIKIHVNRSNPAVTFLTKHGFANELLDLRYYKGQ